MKLPYSLSVLLNALIVTGEHPILIGGACRDIFHGNEPKDYDIMLVGLYDVESVKQSVMLGELSQVTVAAYGEGSAAACRLDFVAKLELEDGTNADLICWVDRHETPEALAAQMDSNLNAYWFDPLYPERGIQFLPNASHLGGYIAAQRTTNDPPSTERLEYLASKYPQYELRLSEFA